MASEQVPSSVLESPPQLPPLQAWLGRLGLSGKILAIGGLTGVIAVFLPLVTMSFQAPAVPNLVVGKGRVNIPAPNLPAVSTSQSVMVIQDFRGVLCLVGYLAALVFTYVLYPPNGLNQKALGWAGLGVGGFIALLALWLLIGAFSGSGGIAGFGFQITVGIGAILNLVAGVAVATAGYLKAREEKLA